MWFNYNTYEVIFTYRPPKWYEPESRDDTIYKGYTVVKAHSHQHAKKVGWPSGLWVTSIHSRLVK